MIPVALVSLVEGWLGPRFAKLAKPLLIGVGAVLLVGALWASVQVWHFFHSPAPQSRVNAAQAQAAQDSGRDAINTVAASGAASAASEAMTRDNEHDIRAAVGANTPVPSAASAAGKAAYCKRDAYRDKSYCKGARP